MSKDTVIIIGAGGHAAELYDYIIHANKSGHSRIEVAGLIDDNEENYQKYDYDAPYIGNITPHKINRDVKYLVGIANLKFRYNIVERFLQEGASFLTFIHPGAYVSPTARIGEGSVIAYNVNLGPNTRVGRFTLINARSSLGHDTYVGDFNFISPNVSFSGGSVIGDHNMFGINSATLPGIKVGNHNKVMAGMVLDKNVADHQVAFFRHKEKIMTVPKSSNK